MPKTFHICDAVGYNPRFTEMRDRELVCLIQYGYLRRVALDILESETGFSRNKLEQRTQNCDSTRCMAIDILLHLFR